MSSVTNQSIKHVVIDIDLSKLPIIDNAANITTANIATAVDAGKILPLRTLNELLGMNSGESAIITGIAFNKLASSANITSSSVNIALKVQRVLATAGLNTKKPTITAGQNENIAVLTLSSANVTLLNARPATIKELTATTGSLTGGSIGVRDGDAGNGTSAGGALIIYADAPTADVSAGALTGKIAVSISYRKMPR